MAYWVFLGGGILTRASSVEGTEIELCSTVNTGLPTVRGLHVHCACFRNTPLQSGYPAAVW